MEQDFVVSFWGVRGTTPCTQASFQKYGGNTMCIELQIGGQRAILDLGSGARMLGQNIIQNSTGCRLPVLFSHLHLDHIQGLPFFAPLYDPSYSVEFYSACQHFGHGSLDDMLFRFCSPPFFPLNFRDLPAKHTCNDFVPGDEINLFEGVRTRTLSIPHPNGCVGYRIDYKGKSLGILCDMMPDAESTNAIVELMHGIDVVLIDGAFNEEQFKKHPDWGHCSWNYCLEIARKLGQPKLFVLHHDILNNDTAVAEMEREAQRLYNGVQFTYEGMSVNL